MLVAPVHGPPRRRPTSWPAVAAAERAGQRLRANLGEHAYQLDGIRDQFLDVLWEPSIPERTVLKDAAAAAVPIQSMSGPAAREVAEVFDLLAARLEQQMKEETR